MSHDIEESRCAPHRGPVARPEVTATPPATVLDLGGHGAARPGRARSLQPLLGSLASSQRAAVLRSLQRNVGNHAVQRMLSAHRPVTVLPGLSGQGPVAVQRSCGGSSTCSCAGCSKGDEQDRDETDAASDRPAASVQRQPFTDGTPENPVATLPPGSRYAGMDSGLLDMLGRTLTGKTFWHWVNVKPRNLGEALDNLGPADLNTLVQLKRRLDLHSLWGHIQTMKTVWTTSSLGIDYNGSPMEGALDAHARFCKDTTIGEAYHSGNCWREIASPPGSPGLHYCTPNSIHVDPHQPTEGHEGGIQFGGGSIVRLRGNYCDYAMSVWLEHMADVVGGRPVNVFHQHRQLGDAIAREKGRVWRLGPRHEEARRQGPILDALEARRTALNETLRGWAIRGFEGDASADAQRVIQEVNAIEAELNAARAALDDVEASETPVLYGP